MLASELKKLSVHDLLHLLRSQVGMAIQTEAQLIHPSKQEVYDSNPTWLMDIGDFRICARFTEPQE